MNREHIIRKFRVLLALIAGILLWIAVGHIGGYLMKVYAIKAFGLCGKAVLFYSAVELLLIPAGLALCYRIAAMRLADTGLTAESWKSDLVVGMLAGTAMAMVQFLILLPLTGGARREDVIAGIMLMGKGFWNVSAMVVVGWVSGGFCEELFFRGHLIGLTRILLGGSRWAAAVALVLSTLYFGYSHAYQGLTGMIDTAGASLIFGLLYLWRGRLTAPIIAHGLYDMYLMIGMALLYM